MFCKRIRVVINDDEMISDSQTNTVYLADALRMDDAAEFKRFRTFLESHGVTVKVLNWTNDIYCRDFMPVQVDKNDFVQFVFKADSGGGSFCKASN